MHRILTSGKGAFDIDAYACIVGVRELEMLEHRTLEVYVPSGFNVSTPQSLWVDIPYLTECPEGECVWQIVDVSDPEGMAACVSLDQVVAIHDHHPGYEDFWRARIGERAVIEPIGVAATLIWELWERSGRAGEMSKQTAKLLAFAIASNTGNFGITLTSERDHRAFELLTQIAGERREWTTPLFQEVDRQIFSDLSGAIQDDTKPKTFPGFGIMAAGQLEISDGSTFFKQHLDVVQATMSSFSCDCWYMSVPSLLTRKNYFYTEDVRIQEMLSSVLGIVFYNNIAVADRL